MEFEKNGIKIKFDIAPFMEDRAKWVNVCYVDLGKVKRRFEKIDDLAAFKDDIIKSYNNAIKNA